MEILQPYENARVFDPACGSGGIPFEEKISKLKKELEQSFKQGDALEQKIIKNLNYIKNENG